MPKVAVIGAGSMVFSRNLLSDILAFDALKDTTFSLMDIDAERLGLVGAMAESINATRGANATIRTERDRRAALDGADFVINTIGVGGFAATKTDLLLPETYGLRQTIGDTLGIGGIFRSLRSLPVVLEMCAEMEELCPDAYLLTYANPVATHCLAIQRATTVKAVGLCHGVRHTRGRMIALARLAEMAAPDVDALLANWDPTETGKMSFTEFYRTCVENESVETLCAGINHMAAFLVFRENGRDLYPLLHKACANPAIRKLEEVRLDLFKRLGYFTTETSGHIAEYLPWYLQHDEEIKRVALRPNCYIGTCERLEDDLQRYKRLAESGGAFIRPDEPVSIEYASQIINASTTGRPYVFNGNVHNDGGALIGNLPGDSCVEVPCVADALGLHPTRVGDLPPQIAAMIRTNINVQDLVVRAVLAESREHVYHAAMMDPNTAATLPLPKIFALVDEMIQAHGGLMPAFLRT